MTSTISSGNYISSLHLFLRQFRRVLPLFAAYGLIYLLMCLIFWDNPDKWTFLHVAVLGFGLLCPLILLSERFGRPRSDFYLQLPVSRGRLYLYSFFASALCMWIPIPLGAGLVHFIATIRRNTLMVMGSELSSTLPSLWAVAGITAVAGFSVLALCFLAAAVSGTYFGYGLSALLLGILFPSLGITTTSFINSTIPGANCFEWLDGLSAWILFQIGSPPAALFANYYITGETLAATVWQGVLGLILLGLGCLIFCRRSPESAGHFGKCRGMELFTRWSLSVGAGIFSGHVAAMKAYDRSWGDKGVPLCLLCILLALICAWIILELLYNRGLKKLFKHWVHLAVPAGVMALFLGIISTGLGLDEAAPIDPQQVMNMRLSSSNEFFILHTDGVQVSSDNPEFPYDKYSHLYPGVSDEKSLELANELKAKFTAAQRASLYPYLPGRDAYPNDRVSFRINYDLKPDGSTPEDGKPHSGSSISQGLYFGSKMTDESKALLDECYKIEKEIGIQPDYVNSLFPLNAFDALSRISQEDLDYVMDYSEDLATAGRKISSFYKDFPDKLRAALYEDFTAGRESTLPGIEENSGNNFVLYYDPGEEFTAAGGIVGYGSGWMEPAAGKRLKIEHYQTAFCVTPEMSSTHKLLKAAFN